jgi:hypothetical protein
MAHVAGTPTAEIIAIKFERFTNSPVYCPEGDIMTAARQQEIERRLEQSKRLLRGAADSTTTDRIGKMIGELENEKLLGLREVRFSQLTASSCEQIRSDLGDIEAGFLRRFLRYCFEDIVAANSVLNRFQVPREGRDDQEICGDRACSDLLRHLDDFWSR